MTIRLPPKRPSNFWAKVAVGGGIGLMLILFSVLLIVCFSGAGQEAKTKDPDWEPVALVKFPRAAGTGLPGKEPEDSIGKQEERVPPTPPLPEKKGNGPTSQDLPAKRKGKFVAERNSSVPLEILTVAEAKIPYQVRRLKLPENQPGKLRLAVSPPGSDNIAEVLGAMKVPFTNIAAENLNSLDKLREFDVLFLNCGGGWSAKAPRNLRKFVELGGTVYASDLQFENIRNTFPELKGPTYAFFGAAQKLKATVVDAGLADYLGTKELDLHFNLGGWKAAFFDKDKTALFLEGEPRATVNFNPQGKPPVKPKVPLPEGFNRPAQPPRIVPLLVKFRYQAGSVIYTSFHTSANLSEQEKKLLQYLVFAAVNAKSATQVALIMAEAGFAPQNLRNYQVSVQQPVPVQKTDHPGGGLQIAVGFENLGAKLRLTLTAPDGQKIEHDENGMFLVEIPSAPRGTWQYTVTAETVPFQNFPIILAVGKTK